MKIGKPQIKLTKGLFTWRWETPGRWGNMLRWGIKITLVYMQYYNPPSRGAHSQDYWMIGEHINKKNAGKPRVLAINALLHSLAALAAIFSAAAFISDSVVTTIFGKIWSRLRGLPGLADRATRLGGSPHLSCKRNQFEARVYMDRRVTAPKRVTPPTWGPPPPCKQALKCQLSQPSF